VNLKKWNVTITTLEIEWHQGHTTEIQKETACNRVLSQILKWPATHTLLSTTWKSLATELCCCCQDIPMELVILLFKRIGIVMLKSNYQTAKFSL